MNDAARNLAQNIRAGSGNHGLTEDQLYDVFKNCGQLDMLAYSLFKCAEVSGKTAFSTQSKSIDEPNLDQFTSWHHIDESWSANWGFDKANPGCYVYGLFEEKPTESANFLDPRVIYIGESRAVTRNCMLGRRTDFKGTVRNDRLSPYGCGTAFKEKFGKDQINKVYQAYLPMHPSYCKITEIKMLSQYFQKFGKIPPCNPPLDFVRVQKYLNKS